MIPIRLLGPKVLVALEPKATAVEVSTGMNYHEAERTASGIILAQPTDMYDVDEHSRGIVMALGKKTGTVEHKRLRAAFVQGFRNLKMMNLDFVEDDVLCILDTLRPAPFDVKVGDVVLFAPSAGVTLGEQGDDISYVILHEKDLLAVIPSKVEAA